MKGSTLNRFLEEVRDAAIQVVPLGEPDAETTLLDPRICSGICNELR